MLAGTIQFATAMSHARERLAALYPSLRVPQCKPLSPGEVLGCTAPVLTEEADAIVFMAVSTAVRTRALFQNVVLGRAHPSQPILIVHGSALWYK